MKLKYLLIAITVCCASSMTPLLAKTTEQLTIIQNGENVGTLVGVTDGRTVEVDYWVDNNGRGPKHHETIRLDRRGIPLGWRIQGTSLMGGAVSEDYSWENGKAKWSSQADEGEVQADQPKLYVVNDASPWASGVYARVLLKTKGNRLDVLPGGSMSLTTVKEMKIGQGKAAVKVTVYRLEGINLAPDYLMLDRKNRLFAKFSGKSVVIRKGYEAEAPELLRLGSELGVALVKERTQKLAHNYSQPVRIRNVHIFDPVTGELGALSTVVVMHDRITSVLKAEEDNNPPTDQVLIEGQGGTLVPGLYDMHSHTSLQSGLFYLAAGVTTTRDQGNDNSFLLDLLPRLQSGEIAGPRVVPNGFMEGRSPYSARYGFIPETIEEAIEAVNWYADRGYWQIKIYNSMNPDWVEAIAVEAHRRGMGVTGHVPAFSNPDRVIMDGYDDIAHINQLMLGWILEPGEDTRTPLRLTAMSRGAYLNLSSPKVQKTVQLMKEKNIALDTTAVILERLMLSRAGTVADGDKDYLTHMPIGYQRYRKRTFVPLKAPEDDDNYRKGFEKLLETLKLLHDNDIQLLPGTDDATGFTVHREIELYVLAGLSPAEALRLGTLACAEYLGKTADLGTIEQGKLADFFLIAGDPTRDIKAIKKPRMVMKGGTVYFPSEIYQSLSIKPFASSPPLVVPTRKATGE
ncbi:MAG: amidohydrolase family protein [Emcibacter sp.]|nr:amidohydrolase family protein [Emcibacter sp.]